MEQKKNPIKVLFQKPEMGTILPLAILMGPLQNRH